MATDRENMDVTATFGAIADLGHDRETVEAKPTETAVEHLQDVVITQTLSIPSVTVTTDTDYKTTHPIGSRKVTENVITYHEPMFQSVANTLFETQKSLTMGKRKLDEEKIKGESGSPDAKKHKTETAKNCVIDSGVKVKKKCSIENIVERIRTEKTLSRGVSILTLNTSSQKAEANKKSEIGVHPTDESTTKTAECSTVSKNLEFVEISKDDETKQCKDTEFKHVVEKETQSYATGREYIDEQVTCYPTVATETNVLFDNAVKEKVVNKKNKKENDIRDINRDILNLQKSKEKQHENETVKKVDSHSSFESEDMDTDVTKVKNKVETEIGESKMKNKNGNKAIKQMGHDNGKSKINIEKVKKGKKKNSAYDVIEQMASEAVVESKDKAEKLTKTKVDIATKKQMKKNKSKDISFKVKKVKVKLIETKPKKQLKTDSKKSTDIKEKVKKRKKKMFESETEIQTTTDVAKLNVDEITTQNENGEGGDQKIKVKKIKKKETEGASPKTKIKAKKEKQLNTCKPNTQGEKNKIKKTKKIQDTFNSGEKEMKKKTKMKKKCDEANTCVKRNEDLENTNGKTNSKNPITKMKQVKHRKPKIPIFYRRTKREASLNAAMLVNILYEKEPKTPKMNMKRSKSESDIAQTPKQTSPLSLSFTELGTENVFTNNVTIGIDMVAFEVKADKPKSPKKECLSPKKLFNKEQPTSPKNEKLSIKSAKKEPLTSCKSPSPKRKVSFSDEVFETVNQEVCKQAATTKLKKERKPAKFKQETAKMTKMTDKFLNIKNTKSVAKMDKNTKIKNIDTKDKGISNECSKIKKVIKVKSPEEIAEKKRKANLARLIKAKELLKAKRLHAEKESEMENVGIDTENVSEVEPRISSDEDDDAKITKIRAKRGELFRAARTHVSVEAKTVFENTASSPKWCECCQTTYYPSQPQQGGNLWRIKQLVDRGSSKSPEPIQSSSHHFIAAHTSCEVRPYSSPTHVPMMDTSPFVGQLMSHGHVTCSACGCGHSGMLHTAQCQNYTLGGVGNLLPCQHYSGTYSVPYSHGHSSYTRCGCASCCTAGTYHHAGGQPHLHQSQMPMSADASILLHRPVQLQMAHDSPHSVPIQLSHTDSPHAAHPLPVQLGHTESNMQHMSHGCQFSQGEITTIIRSNSQSDQEFIDVGKDDVIKSSAQMSQQTISYSEVFSSKSDTNLKSPKVRKSSSTTTDSVKHKSSQSSENGKKCKNDDQKEIKKSVNKTTQKDQEKNRKNSEEIKKKNKPSEMKDGKSKVDKIGNKSNKKDVEKKSLNKKEKNESININNIERQDSAEHDKEVKMTVHGWSWDGEGVVKKVIDMFDGHPVQRRCFSAIRHDDGDTIQIKDCILVCSGCKKKDIPYVAKVTNFWEDPVTEEMMMSVLWYYRPEHTEGGRKHEHQDNEVLAAKHRDETLVACIEDRGYVLTYNEYCRFMAEVKRTKQNFPPRKKVVPDSEEPYPSNRIPSVDVDPENVFLCRQVYDIKLKRVLKNPS